MQINLVMGFLEWWVHVLRSRGFSKQVVIVWLISLFIYVDTHCHSDQPDTTTIDGDKYSLYR